MKQLTESFKPSVVFRELLYTNKLISHISHKNIIGFLNLYKMRPNKLITKKSLKNDSCDQN